MPLSRLFSAIVLFAIPALAFANYGMSIAYSVFDKRYWSICVTVTVIFEALAIAWWFRLSIWRGLWTSLIANSATAFVMVLVAAFLPLGEGDVRNPSPLLWCLRIFAVLAILSAITEAVIWSRFLDKRMALQMRYLVPSLAIHTIGFIIGFAILLVPSHPFVSLEMDLARLHSLKLKSQLPVAFD